MPAPGILNGDFAPDTCSAVKIDEVARTVTTALLYFKVVIQSNSLCPGKKGVVLIQVLPARLDQADPGIFKSRQCSFQEIPVGQEIRIKDGNEVSLGLLKPVLDRKSVV